MSWLLAITRSRQENRVSDALKSLAINHHLFKYRRKTVRRGRQIEDVTPAFPRYLFVDVAADWMWRKILELQHVVCFATGADFQPWVVPQIALDRFVSRLDSDGLLPYIPPSRFQFGDKLWVSGLTSIVSGHQATYQFPTHPGRSCVLMDWLGRIVPVEIDDRDLEKYEARYNRRRRRRGGRRNKRREGLAAYQPRASTIEVVNAAK